MLITGEFYNSKILGLFHRLGIQYFSVQSDTKNAIVERFNRTIKTIMFRAFTDRGNHKWVDIISDILQSYNNSYHRTIKMAPNQVSLANEATVRSTIYTPKAGGRPVFKQGDLVRLARKDSIFRKGYLENWTFEVFKIDKINKTVPVTYTVVEFNGSPVTGSFYKEELQKINKDKDIWSVEKIIKKRKLRDGSVELRVKWLGFDNSYNSWVKQSDVV